jgi:hypothetical protein
MRLPPPAQQSGVLGKGQVSASTGETGRYILGSMNRKFVTPMNLLKFGESTIPKQIGHRGADNNNGVGLTRDISERNIQKVFPVTHSFSKTHQLTYFTLSRCKFSQTLPRQGKCDDNQSVEEKGLEKAHKYQECAFFIQCPSIAMNDVAEISTARPARKVK